MDKRQLSKIDFDHLSTLSTFAEASYDRAIRCYVFNHKLLQKYLDENKISIPIKVKKAYKKYGIDSFTNEDLDRMCKSDTHVVQKTDGNCFANMWRLFGTYEKDLCLESPKDVCYPDTVIYHCRLNHHSKLNLTTKAIRTWMNLCVKNGLLPRDININAFMKTGLFRINLFNQTPQLLYIYLCNVRNIQEEPGIIAFCLHLVERLKCDFLLAYYIAEFFCRKNPGHSYISSASSRKPKPDMQDMQVENILRIKKVFKFIADNKERCEKKKIKKKDIPDMNPKVTSAILDTKIKDQNKVLNPIIFKKIPLKKAGDWIRDI